MSSAWSSAADDGADGVRPDLVPALDQLDELVHDRARGGDPVVGPLDRQLVPAQAERAVQPVAQRVEHAVADSAELGGDFVRDGEHFLHPAQCRRRIPHKVRRRKKSPIQEVISLGQELASTYQWVNVDELDLDDEFERLVELLADPASIDDETFADIALRGAKFLRAGAMAAIAAGRPPPPGWTETAEGRFERGEWGERQLLLRALAGSDGKVIPAVLAAAEEDWAGSPLAREVSASWTRVSQPGRAWTVAELETLDASLQPLVRELIDQADIATKAALRPALEQWQSTTIDVDFFRALGRVLDPGARPPATLVGSRIAAVDALVGALSSSRPRSVLVIGEPGVGKTTLIVEALRRLGDERFAFQAGANDVNAGQAFIGMLEARVQEIVDRVSQRPIVWVFPAFEEALWSGQHMQSPRGVLDALLPHVEAGDAVVVGEIDPRAYELVLQHRPRLARLFEVVRLAPATGADAIAVARGWADQNDLEVDDETLAEALDLATHYLPAAAAPGNVLRVLELVRDRIARGVASAVDPETVIATLSEATGLPLHVLDPTGAAEPRAGSRLLRRSRPRAAGGGRVPRRPDRAREGRPH